jgi:hypothetical protein
VTNSAALMPGGVNHRELLAMLERQATRVNALEAGLARLDERMREQPCASLASQPSPGRASVHASPNTRSNQGSRGRSPSRAINFGAWN